MWELFSKYDVVTPSENTSVTNITGTPSIVVPTGFAIPTVPLPTSIAFLGPIYQDEKPTVVAHAFQQATDFHKKRPLFP
ncbi:MAG TPA: hypothetical protein VH559_14465 [Gemmatimonadaceae bacterium]